MTKTIEPCRLCQGATTRKFDRLVLEKYPTGYFECNSCGSLQTERPYWLGEAYAIPGVHVDVGQAARVVQTWLRLCFLLQNINFDLSAKCVDYGGSAGLLTRLMRDSGYAYFAYDLYDDSKYANYFRIENFTQFQPVLISAIEVIEHFPEPRLALTEMLASKPELVVFTTQFYEAQGPDWAYLVPFCGQHVFFYTLRGLEQFAAQFGYELLALADFWAFVKRGGPYAKIIKTVAGRNMDAAFAGNLLMRVGWGTEATNQDGALAIERFIRERKS